MHGAPEAPHGRGAASNPPNRFTPLWHVRDPDWTDPEDPAPTTLWRFLGMFAWSDPRRQCFWVWLRPSDGI